MTSGGQDPNQNPEGGNNEPQQGGTPPPPGNYPPPPGGTPPPPPPGNYPPPPGSYPPPPGPGGGYPPPPGNYPPPGSYPPPQGGYPPPPGSYPPPPPAFDSGYGQPGPGAGLSVGAAISYGWSKFSANALSWVVLMLIAAVIQGLLNWAFSSSNNAVSLIGGLISIIVGYLLQAAFVTGALQETDGTKPSIGSFFQIRNVGAVIVACFLVGVLTTVGLILCIIPGLIAIFLTSWTLQFVIDQNQDPIGAIKSSFGAISSNWGTLLLLALALLGINILGAIPVGLGLLITVPLSIITITYAYRVTVGGPVAP
ncbi:putative membrane protein [Rhodococcus sp. OK519]|uniref:hypothetical protein n=1 Tax=Rhodococcus sp. OK519 TaxID=2135729 RepID=UPI000D374A30|nr:putative membrane protein [Rhodococcus sp. OK519]